MLLSCHTIFAEPPFKVRTFLLLLLIRVNMSELALVPVIASSFCLVEFTDRHFISIIPMKELTIIRLRLNKSSYLFAQTFEPMGAHSLLSFSFPVKRAGQF
jgi:hypothetical protein